MTKFIKINRQIIGSVVRLVQDGQQLGIFPLREAQEKARQLGLDIVEVAPNANPPVCQIMDWGKYRFEQKKKQKEKTRKNKQIKMKEIQLKPLIEEHDLGTKISAIKNFLLEGRNVQVTMLVEKLIHKEMALEIMSKVVSSVKDAGSPEKSPFFMKRRLSVRILPLPRE